MTEEYLNPAKRLTGVTLPDDWLVGDILPTGRRYGGTGGFFSISYEVSKGSKTAFLKAFDIFTSFEKARSEKQNFTSILLAHLQAYEFETKLHDICANKNMKRIVKILAHGHVELPPLEREQISTVPYMIMEMADGGDVRNYIGRTDYIDLSLKLYYLRDIASGLIQLHGAHIAHQDLKPSNIMIFGGALAKIGDLGRASKRDIESSNDSFPIAGDYAYAPPEQLYGYELKSWKDRRQRCDLYQFASLISYLFFDSSLNAIYRERLPVAIIPVAWEGDHDSYLDALPYLQQVFNEVLAEWQLLLPQWLAHEIIDVIRQCGTPVFGERGSRKVINSNSPDLGINRFVSQFDKLGFRASLEVKKLGKQKREAAS